MWTVCRESELEGMNGLAPSSRPQHTTYDAEDEGGNDAPDEVGLDSEGENDDTPSAAPTAAVEAWPSNEVHSPLLSMARALSTLPDVPRVAPVPPSIFTGTQQRQPTMGPRNVVLRPYDEPFWPEALLVVRT